jgi:hypothetical protein
MVARQERKLLDGVQFPGNVTGPAFRFNRIQDDEGLVKVDFEPNSPPGTFTVELQGRLDDPALSLPGRTWFVITTITEAQTGSGAGVNTHAETFTIFPYMRAVSSNNDDPANTVVVSVAS